MTHTIVVVGGNIAGLSTAHYILRNVVTHLPNPSNYKVTVISPSSHSMFKIGAPRTIISSTLVENEAIFASIPDGFKSYPAGQFTFVQGEAIAVDPATKTIAVKSDAKKLAVHYDSLIIATGTTPNSALWGLKGPYKNSITAFHDIQKQLPSASTILIAGGGAAGVETAGEIAYTHKPKSLTLLSGTTQLLPRLNNKGVGKSAESRLKRLGVKIVHEVRVLSTEQTAEGKTAVSLSDGKKVVVDLYIDVTGGVPNTRFLPETWLDSRSRVAVEPTTLRATQAPAGVYSVGDVASYSKQGVLDATWAVPGLGYSLYSDLKATSGKKAAGKGKQLKEKTYKQIEADMQFVPIGPKGGVGVIMGWQVPSWVVWMIKSRTFFIEKSAGVATGAEVEKA